MFQLADHLVGIFKTNNRTKNVSLSSSLLKRFEKLEKSFRTSNEIKHEQKGTQNQVPDQKKLAESKVLEVKSSPQKETLEKKRSHDGKEQVNLPSKLRKSDTSLEDQKDQSNKKSVTFDLSPSENKENTFVSCDSTAVE